MLLQRDIRSPLGSRENGFVTEEFWGVLLIGGAGTRRFLIAVGQTVCPRPGPASDTHTHTRTIRTHTQRRNEQQLKNVNAFLLIKITGNVCVK